MSSTPPVLPHAAATPAMTGLIRFVQPVHCRLFACASTGLYRRAPRAAPLPETER